VRFAFGRANPDAKLQLFLRYSLGLPLDVEANSGDLAGILPQLSLIGIPLKQSGRYGDSSLVVEQMGEDFSD
jgi:hypothetical protein